MRKMFFTMSILVLAIVASCTTDSLDSVVGFEEEKKEISNLSSFDEWEELGVIHEANGVFDADSVVIGTTYNILYTDNNALKVYYSEEKKADIIKLNKTSFSLSPHSEVEVLISNFKENNNTLYFEYTLPKYGVAKIDSKEIVKITKTKKGLWFEKENNPLIWSAIINEMVRITNNAGQQSGLDNGNKSCDQRALEVCGKGMVKSVISGWLGSCKYECY